LKSPFEGILKSTIAKGVALPGIDDKDALKNQIASLFGRWVLPHSGFEFYAEYGHEDHNADNRDLISEPDHSRIAMAGLRKVFPRGDDEFSAFRAEYIDGSESTLGRYRAEGLIYVHSPLRQGHTQDGQLIGADIGVGSPVGAIIAWDTYSPHGRSTWYVQRLADDNRDVYIADRPATYTASHLFGTLGYEARRFGSRADLTYGIAATEGKRDSYLQRQINLSATLGVVVHLWQDP
jgi:hypothetical protein